MVPNICSLDDAGTVVRPERRGVRSALGSMQGYLTSLASFVLRSWVTWKELVANNLLRNNIPIEARPTSMRITMGFLD